MKTKLSPHVTNRLRSDVTGTLLWLLTILPGAAAQPADTNISAQVVMERVRGNRAEKDFAFKARLFVGRAQPSIVSILMKNTPQDTRTVYQSGTQSSLLVIQPVRGPATYYMTNKGELTGPDRLQKLFGAEFTPYDLALPFLQWERVTCLGKERRTGRDCLLIEAKADNEPFARVKMWIDEEYAGLLRAEAFNTDDQLVKRYGITSFKRVGDVWIPKGIEVATVPAGQSLPSQEKSRLEMFEADDEPKFSADQFDPTSPLWQPKPNK
jgi:hypothetical protein